MIKKTVYIILLLVAGVTSAYARGAVPYIFNLPTCESYGKRIIFLDNGHRYFDPVIHSTNVNIGFGYGIIDSLSVDTAFSFKNMDLTSSIKYSFLRDDTGQGSPISMAVVAGGGYKIDTEEVLNDDDQLSCFIEVIVQKHLFKNRFSLALLPIFAYNTNFYKVESDYDFSLGMGAFAEFYFVDRFSVCGEVIMNFYGFAFKYMHYNVGFKYAGYRHTFSLWISNSAGYSPVEYIVGNTTLEPRASFAFTREFDI